MKTILNANTGRGSCAALLVAVAVALAAPRAGAESAFGRQVSDAGNERIRTTDLAEGYVSAGSSSSSAFLEQIFETWTDDGGVRHAFVLRAGVAHREGVGSIDVRLYVKGELVLPPVHGNEFTLRGTYPGETTQLPFDSFSHLAGSTSVAVGGQAYSVFARWYIRFEFDLAGHAYSPSEIALSGNFDTIQAHYFYADLPENVMLEYVGSSSAPPLRFSHLSCNLYARGSTLFGNWCRFQQDPLELRARLIHTATLGGLTYTEIIPVVDDEIPAVDRYLIDRRPQRWLRPLRR